MYTYQWALYHIEKALEFLEIVLPEEPDASVQLTPACLSEDEELINRDTWRENEWVILKSAIDTVLGFNLGNVEHLELQTYPSEWPIVIRPELSMYGQVSANGDRIFFIGKRGHWGS